MSTLAHPSSSESATVTSPPSKAQASQILFAGVMSLTSKEAKAAASPKEEKEGLLEEKVRWKPKTPVKEAAQLSSIAGAFLEQFGEDISQGMADDRTVVPAAASRVPREYTRREGHLPPAQAQSSSSSAEIDQESEAKSRKRTHSATAAASAEDGEEAGGKGRETQEKPMDLQSQPEQAAKPQAAAKKFHSYSGATFGIQPAKQAPAAAPLHTSPLNPWYLSLGTPNFAKTHKPPEAGSAQKRPRIDQSELEKKFEDSWWKPYVEQADRIVAAAAPVVGQQPAESDEKAAEKDVEASEPTPAVQDTDFLRAIRQEKEADKKLQEKILEAIVDRP